MSRRVALLVAGLLLCALCAWAPPAFAEPAGDGAVVAAFPAAPVEEPPPGLPCVPTDILCGAGQAFGWLGDQVGQVVGDAWISAMTALWEAGLWVLGLAFGVIDSLTTPDLSAGGPLSQVYPITFGLGAALAGVLAGVLVTTSIVLVGV